MILMTFSEVMQKQMMNFNSFYTMFICCTTVYIMFFATFL